MPTWHVGACPGPNGIAILNTTTALFVQDELGGGSLLARILSGLLNV
ncbi:MAG: hypothetical protein ACRDS0_30580 [Pseudonocardiaceae bacterium]